MPENNTTQLTRVTIRGFKSIAYDRPVELLLGKVNLLLGANGAGKSTIVSFFKMLEYMMSGSLQRYINENGKSQIFLHYGTKRTPTIVNCTPKVFCPTFWGHFTLGGVRFLCVIIQS